MSNAKDKVAKNWSLILGLSIPLLMTLFIAVSIYLPRFFDNTPPPTINFLYSSNTYYPHLLEVKNNKLEWEIKENENQNNKRSDQPPRIYLHDVVTNKSSELNLEEAQKLTLDSRLDAPDGYIVKQNYNRGFFLFDGNRSRSHHLVNDRSSHKLNLVYQNNYYYNFKFLGWVIE